MQMRSPESSMRNPFRWTKINEKSLPYRFPLQDKNWIACSKNSKVTPIYTSSKDGSSKTTGPALARPNPLVTN